MVTNSAPQKTWNSKKNHFKIQIQPKEMKNRLLVHHREMSFSRESSFTPLFHNSIKTRWLQNFIWIKNPVLPFFAFFQVDTLLKIGYFGAYVHSISSIASYTASVVDKGCTRVQFWHSLISTTWFGVSKFLTRETWRNSWDAYSLSWNCTNVWMLNVQEFC